MKDGLSCESGALGILGTAWDSAVASVASRRLLDVAKSLQESKNTCK